MFAMLRNIDAFAPDVSAQSDSRHGEHSAGDVSISIRAMLRVLEGVEKATKAEGALVDSLRKTLMIHGSHNECSAQSFDVWRDNIIAHNPGEPKTIKGLAQVTLAIALLREMSHQELPATSDDLDSIWRLVYEAIIESPCNGLQFNASRSAQGFLAVALCSLISEGKIEELWRLHVWLPDGERGGDDITIHAHQPFAQSWILAGSGEDLTFHGEETDDQLVATHAKYEPSWAGQGKAEKGTPAYQTHQLSSTVTNTGDLVRLTPMGCESHTRDMTYTVPAGVYHRSKVSGSEVHATLFVFDARRGFEQKAAVLGPKGGISYTQIRDPSGITSQVLAHLTNETRLWEQSNSFTHEGPDYHTTATTYYRYFHGMALLRDGNPREALEYFNNGEGSTCAQVFARVPLPRHRQFLETLIEAGTDIDLEDDVGCKALDYSVYNEDEETEQLLMDGLKKQLGDRKAERRLYESHVRKVYREVFEDQLRHILLSGVTDTLKSIRYSYAKVLEEKEERSRLFNGLHYITYADFCSSGRLPRYADGTTRTFGYNEGADPEHIVYAAYRWIYKDPVTGKTANDDTSHTQYRRMLQAIAQYLDRHPSVDRSSLGIWVDSSCIDRKDPLPGIAALPMNLAQCDALITIEDNSFWDRAWCSVEALMIQILRRRYQRHEWFRYVKVNEDDWVLREASIDFEIDMSTKAMTWEEDRDKITFLQRQARLL